MTPQPPTLDFSAIRTRCPRAFEAAFRWFAYDPLEEILCETDQDARYWPGLEPEQTRDLYDFFDVQGVFILTARHQWFNTIYWKYIFEEVETFSCSQGAYPTRPQAEAAAFTAAFERLETMLENITNENQE